MGNSWYRHYTLPRYLVSDGYYRYRGRNPLVVCSVSCLLYCILRTRDPRPCRETVGCGGNPFSHWISPDFFPAYFDPADPPHRYGHFTLVINEVINVIVIALNTLEARRCNLFHKILWENDERRRIRQQRGETMFDASACGDSALCCCSHAPG